MCGILAVLSTKTAKVKPERAQEMARKLKHRGPDESGVYVGPTGHVLCHERLSIIDLTTGHQPIQGTDGAWVIHNGEIYNHVALHAEHFPGVTFRTHSDSEIIVRMWEKFGSKCVDMLDGVFATVIVDGDKAFVARDAIGVKPLFYGEDKDGCLWFASEQKALIEDCVSIKEFPAGHYFTPEEGFVQWFMPAWYEGAKPLGGPEKLRSALTEAVRKRLMSDVPVGVLLSGGLDSSLITSIVSREYRKCGKKVKSFSVGLSPDCHDLVKARKVAEFLGTDHHEVIYSVEEGIAMLEELIQKVETYDVTTIRASTPMLIMMKEIRKRGVKVVLSGEGADEIFGGYLYFGNAPSAEEFHGECLRRIKRLHTSDVQRVDRSTMGAGVEARVPFLDKAFLKEAMSLDPKYKVIDRTKGVMEKMVLRASFDTPEDPYLPEEVLWRQKEQFSDGVGYSWVDSLKAYTEAAVSDEEYARREELYPHNTPTTKEAFFYRTIFARHFPHKESALQVKKWIPRWQTDLDPSGRANTDHEKTYHKGEKGRVESADFLQQMQLSGTGK